MLAKIKDWLKIDQQGHQNGEDDTSIVFEEKSSQRGISSVTGDGKAVFLGEGTEDEYQEDLEKELGWYGKLKNWGLK